MKSKLTKQEQFFYDHAGYSYRQDESPQQGRIRCARAMAKAEQAASNLGWKYEWEWDQDADLSWMTDEERLQEHEVLCCRIPDPKNRKYSLASLCGITDPDANYRRVIEAELASEALAELQARDPFWNVPEPEPVLEQGTCAVCSAPAVRRVAGTGYCDFHGEEFMRYLASEVTG